MSHSFSNTQWKSMTGKMQNIQAQFKKMTNNMKNQMAATDMRQPSEDNIKGGETQISFRENSKSQQAINDYLPGDLPKNIEIVNDYS